jgi:hypothetical protein
MDIRGTYCRRPTQPLNAIGNRPSIRHKSILENSGFHCLPGTVIPKGFNTFTG